jgi:uncharacterized Zn finger protein
MALYGFAIIAIRETKESGGQDMELSGGMVEATSEYEAMGKATRLANRHFSPPGHTQYGLQVWPATRVLDPDGPTWLTPGVR